MPAGSGTAWVRAKSVCRRPCPDGGERITRCRAPGACTFGECPLAEATSDESVEVEVGPSETASSRSGGSSGSWSSSSQDADAAWSEAKELGRTTDAEDFAKVEATIASLEKASEPWGGSEVEQASTCLATLQKLVARDFDLDAIERASARLKKLEPRWKQAEALAKQREQKRKDDEAKKAAEVQKKLLPSCVSCCLQATTNASRDHCTEACGVTVSAYLVKNPFNESIFCARKCVMNCK